MEKKMLELRQEKERALARDCHLQNMVIGTGWGQVDMECCPQVAAESVSSRLQRLRAERTMACLVSVSRSCCEPVGSSGVHC